MLVNILFDIFTQLKRDRVNIETKKLVYAAYYPLLFVGLLWLVKLVEYFTNSDFSDLGNYPRSIEHISGILVQPFIHGDFWHLWSNTVPLLFLIWALFHFYGDISFKVSLYIWLGSGVLTWIIGRPSFHIGASGLVYGIAFFLFFSGILRKMRTLMALSGIVALTYGGFVWNMLPVSEIWKPELSWEGHLSGAIVGTVLAIAYCKHPPQPIEVIDEPISEEEPIYEYWLEEPEAQSDTDDTKLNV